MDKEKFLIKFTIITTELNSGPFLDDPDEIVEKYFEECYELYRSEYQHRYDFVTIYIEDYLERMKYTNYIYIEKYHDLDKMLGFFEKIIDEYGLYADPYILFGELYRDHFKSKEHLKDFLSSYTNRFKISYDPLDDEFNIEKEEMI